jgi:YD repeat-containing protein
VGRNVADGGSGTRNVSRGVSAPLDRSNFRSQLNYPFNAASQLTGRRYPDGSRVTFAWDETGNRTLMDDATGRSTWLYDALHRTPVNRRNDAVCWSRATA